ncbi:hypothetical protein [Helicobacter trogontum]|uniref:hypothetical protein n=1 Tax=Helicobacter trogontum TaxID=50960 RepID=UPI002A914293|nr:hypothetical protein [Helicobacter trogontum]MDY5186234.1 hypothetical protein [Helicobacter trogontum]
MKQNISTQYSSNDFLVLENKAICFAKENDCIDSIEIIKTTNIESIYMSWFGLLLTGSKEFPNNPLFFGELNKEGVFIESKPVYHLSGEIDYDSKDSKESFTQTLQVFLNGDTLTLLNYSLLDSSLNIKLECNSKESKAIQEREQTQREQIQRDSNSIDSLTSTAMLHPILEDDEIKVCYNIKLI